MSHRKTENLTSLVAGALAGAAAMYLLDPEQGRKRREFLKSQTEDCLAGTSEALQGGIGEVKEKVLDVGQKLADKAEDYGQRLTQVAQEYGQRLSDHAKEAHSALNDRADAAGSTIHDAADNLSDYGNQLWSQIRGLGKKVGSRAEDALDRARSLGEEPSSPAIPIAATAVGCAAIGVGLMFLMDPQRGQARRQWLVDGLSRAVKSTGASFYRTGKDVASRVTGSTDPSAGQQAGDAEMTREEQEPKAGGVVGHNSPEHEVPNH